MLQKGREFERYVKKMRFKTEAHFIYRLTPTCVISWYIICMDCINEGAGPYSPRIKKKEIFGKGHYYITQVAEEESRGRRRGPYEYSIGLCKYVV